MRLLQSLRLIVAFGAIVACNSDSGDTVLVPPVQPHVFVGHVAGSQALVAIVESDDNVVA